MPLVRIALRKGHPPGFGRQVGAIVHQAMVETIGVPPRDVFQIITEHDAEGLIYDPGYLDIARTDGIVIIQVTLSTGRSEAQKKAFYKTVAESLRERAGLRPEDVFVNLVEVTKADWSFGNGIAQYLV
jgi:phenylpyruvate tautomerase PptA (4-oxalocrotonate tautomerase family)